MPGKLVKCPTCQKEMSTMADACPHCGETHFTKEEVDTKEVTAITKCSNCGGSCEDWDEEVPFLFRKKYKCRDCDGTGYQKKVIINTVDIRTNETVSRETKYNSAPRPELSGSSGCLLIIAAFLSLATSLLFAIGL